MIHSPYLNTPLSRWQQITNDLIEKHPLTQEELKDFVFDAWNGIFESRFGQQKLRIGVDIFPRPQIIGALLHELIPAEAASRRNDWRKEETAKDKDLVYIPDDFFSIEIKTSSNRSKIFGNRSYAQPSAVNSKNKDGFYLTVNFEPFSTQNPRPNILLIRFGWLDHSDWRAQTSPTGQQANLSPETYNLKFQTIYSRD